MARNHESLKLRKASLSDATLKLAAGDAKRNHETKGGSSKHFKVGDFILARKLRIGTQWIRGALCEGWFDAHIVKKGKIKHTFDIKYVKDGDMAQSVPIEVEFARNKAIGRTCQILKAGVADPALSIANGLQRVGSSGACVSERVAEAASKCMEGSDELKKAMESNKVSSADFDALVATKFTSSLADPGEAVGAIAAQSVGEPSTVRLQCCN
jgi:hypothetical protein